MNIAARLTLAAIAAPHLVACVTDANRCVAGLRYAPEYDACLPASSPAADGGAAPAVTDAAPDAASPDGAAAASALGAACSASSDCAGRASYCLKDPTAAPTDPGICSIPQCTASDCTDGYACCDCSGAALASLLAWPAGVCAPSANGSTLTALGCTCL
jgi:hypothetical protein